MVDFEKPNNNEVNRWILDVTKHSLHVEYYLNQLGLGKNDIQRPHDLVGEFNKFDWEVLRGLSLTYRRPNADFETQILPSIELHRNQYHHQMWNQYNPNATEEDLFVGAIDATCSLLEKRVYAGGKEQRKLGKEHDWEEAIEKLNENKEQYKVNAANIIIPEMIILPEPNLERITSLNNIYNPGVDKDIFFKTKQRVAEVVLDLKERGYNIL